MSNPIVKRYCLLLEGCLASPLLAGSGKDIVTDFDVIVDSAGRPYLPGSSLAGASLHYLKASFPDQTDALTNLFGSREGYRSRLYCYHTELFLTDQEERIFSRRDGVKLDEFKTAEDQAKYELQIVESGSSFRMRLEWILREDSVIREEKEEALLCMLLDGIARGELTFGAKSRRGFGRLKLERVSVTAFQHSKGMERDNLRWLDWDWQQNDFDHFIDWQPGESTLRQAENSCLRSLRANSRWHELRIPLAVRQTMMIRQYNTSSSGKVDYEQLTGGAKNRPVIPGTSWAGAIRRHLLRIVEEISADRNLAAFKISQLFGSWTDGAPENRNRLEASLLRIEETEIVGGTALLTSRTAIDRFTGGAKSGALFTTRPWVHGHTELVIRWMDKKREVDENGVTLSHEAICGLLLWMARDLQDGLLPIGGETAIGRGVMEKAGEIQLDGKAIDPGFESRCSLQALKWCDSQHQEENQA
ncbi:RAMP superfamily CRISPR-associated protein [Brevibacillus parabrevis]|uniref:RAMP superfamily CRISPR-associated protein n=1 Tax=Brevibacillus parabrevis TaxID=54914 RepID=UPI0028D4E5A5|nr:RAMP superfamily CRISPR-associated protein [Brevibacillus parabrevis]